MVVFVHLSKVLITKIAQLRGNLLACMECLAGACSLCLNYDLYGIDVVPPSHQADTKTDFMTRGLELNLATPAELRDRSAAKSSLHRHLMNLG